MNQSKKNYNRVGNGSGNYARGNGGSVSRAGGNYARGNGGSVSRAGGNYARGNGGSASRAGGNYARGNGGSVSHAGGNYARRAYAGENHARGNNSGGAYGRGADRQTEYIYGNVVYQPDVRRPQEAPRRHAEPAVRKNRDRARRMSAGYVLFLAAAMCVCALILVNYVQLQAKLTNVTRSVADQESRLNALRSANDEAYNRIVRSVNLEDVKRVAICDLGMTNAREGQIIFYEKEERDYMRQVSGD